MRTIIDLYERASKTEQLEETANRFDLLRRQATCRIFTKFLSTATPPCEVLEIGPASGFITAALAKVLPSSGTCSLDVMDFSRGFLASTKAKGFAVRNYIHGNIVTGEGLSGLEGKYDFVLLEEVLEHLTAPYDALANINRILKPGGCVLLTVPNGGHWRQLYAQHVRAGQLLEHGPMLDTHIAELSLLGILKLIAMAGFVPLELSYYATRAPILKSLMSPQVGLVLQRECSPETRWQALAEARYQPPG